MNAVVLVFGLENRGESFSAPYNFCASCSCVVVGNMHASSRSAMIPPGFFSMRSRTSWLSTNSMYDQSIASRSYSSCSVLNTCWLKCCCSFSLARLMQNCSNELVLNDSKP